MPLFSIITPTYNSVDFVQETIQSVQAQTLADWELIVVDDGSVDDTVAIVRTEADSDARIKLLAGAENRGAAVARNTGIEEAGGRYIAFLDSDDLWFPTKLETQKQAFERMSPVLVYSAYERLDDATGRRTLINVPESIDYSGLLNSTVIATLTAAYDTQMVGKVYMPQIRKRQDYGLWLKLLRSGGVAIGIQEPLAVLRKRADSLSSNKWSAMWHTWRVYRECEGLSLARSSYHFVNYAARAWLKSL